MDIKAQITSIQDKIEKTNNELSSLEEQIKKIQDEIIPTLIDFIKKILMEKAEYFYINSEQEINNPKSLRAELKNTIEEIGSDLQKKFNDNNIWNFGDRKDKDLYIYEDEIDLSKNKKLWMIIENSIKKIDELFTKYNFPFKDNSYSHSQEYHSPYRIYINRMEDIFGYGFKENPSLVIINNINNYWKTINKKFKLLESLELLNEDLRKYKRKQDWES